MNDAKENKESCHEHHRYREVQILYGVTGYRMPDRVVYIGLEYMPEVQSIQYDHLKQNDGYSKIEVSELAGGVLVRAEHLEYAEKR